MTQAAPDLRYPIGEFSFDGPLTGRARADCIARIAAAPAALRSTVAGLSIERLDTAYRTAGWTVRQVVHHVPDSHLNAYTRFKLSLTESRPVIKPYLEARWAEFPDASTAPVDVSLDLLDALHRRWVSLLGRLRPEDWARGYHHPEQGRDYSLDEALALYAWHGEHHVAHITSLRYRMGWG